MFQYACARSLSLEVNLPLKFSIDKFGIYNSHNGFELTKVFDLNIEIASNEDLVSLIGRSRSLPSVRRALVKYNFSWLAGRHFLSDPCCGYSADLPDRARQGGYLEGYWQSEHYFSKHAADIRADFSFREDFQGANLQIANAITQSTAISIHVRRGDYINNPKTFSVHGVCPPDYYYAAIERLLEHSPGARLFAFSDDPQWVSEVLQRRYPELVCVNQNKGSESYNDMRLMSMCHHHIIANSSFSWWGAWLNSKPNKIVIAPARWFTDKRDTSCLIPEGWERL
jgi:hypothetical protein